MWPSPSTYTLTCVCAQCYIFHDTCEFKKERNQYIFRKYVLYTYVRTHTHARTHSLAHRRGGPDKQKQFDIAISLTPFSASHPRANHCCKASMGKLLLRMPSFLQNTHGERTKRNDITAQREETMERRETREKHMVCACMCTCMYLYVYVHVCACMCTCNDSEANTSYERDLSAGLSRRRGAKRRNTGVHSKKYTTDNTSRPIIFGDDF